MVQQVAQPGLSHTTRHGRNFRCAQSQLGIQRANLVANAQFTEAPETVPHVAADVDAIDAVIRQRIIFRVNLKRGVAGVGVWGKKPAALRAEWSEQFRLDAIRIAEQNVGPPFRPEPGYVHEREARSRREIHVAALRAVDFKRRLEHGRRIIFLHDLNQQAGLAVFLDEPVARGIVAPNSGQPRQHFVEFRRIDRLALEAFHVASDVGGFVRVGAFDFDELRSRNIAALPRFARLLMLLPICIAESKRFEQSRARIRGFVTALHNL